MIKEMDIDGDGLLEFAEFEKIMQLLITWTFVLDVIVGFFTSYVNISSGDKIFETK